MSDNILSKSLAIKKPSMLKIPTTASNIVYLQICFNVIVKEFGKVVYNTNINQNCSKEKIRQLIICIDRQIVR